MKVSMISSTCVSAGSEWEPWNIDDAEVYGFGCGLWTYDGVNRVVKLKAGTCEIHRTREINREDR